MADRYRGVGFDQLLIVEPPQQPDVDFHYRIFNADGNEVAQCGNGARCLAQFVRMMGLTWKNRLKVSTIRGVLGLKIHRDGNVTVEMGVPKLEPDRIPMRYAQKETTYSLEVEGIRHRFGAVSLGNPHCVLTVEDVEQAPVDKLGEAICHHSMFPEQVNVGFMQLVSDKEMNLRVFERGVGETQACGSGACAAAVVGILQHNMASRVTVNLPGGSLVIDWNGPGKSLYMTGPAEFVFEGQLEV